MEVRSISILNNVVALYHGICAMGYGISMRRKITSLFTSEYSEKLIKKLNDSFHSLKQKKKIFRLQGQRKSSLENGMIQ